jgi:hypothetical protein
MQNLRKIYETELQKKGLHSEIEKANETFEVKPFVYEFLKLKQLVSFLRPCLSVFSIVTGFGFLYYQFGAYLNLYVAVVLALVLLVGIELIKGELSTLAFKRTYIRANGLSFVLALFALAFFGLSVFLSVNGAKEIYKQLDTKTSTHQTTINHKTDSIRSYFDNQIATERKALDDFKNSVSWQGKININDKAVANSLTSYQTRIDNLLNDKTNALKSLESLASLELSSIQQKTGFEIEFWFWLSIGIEFSILLCLWFLVFFAYCTSNESTIFDTLPTETLTTQISNFLSLVSTNPVQSVNAVSGQLGIVSNTFDNTVSGLVSKPENQADLPTDRENTQSVKLKKTTKKTYLLTTKQRQENAYTDYQNGTIDFRILMSRHKLNVDQMSEVKQRIYGNTK